MSTYVWSGHETPGIKARGGEVVGEVWERIELGLEIAEAGLGGGDVREEKEGGLFQVLGECDAEKAEESYATWGVGVLGDAGGAV